jgi:hypothetical protein
LSHFYRGLQMKRIGALKDHIIDKIRKYYHALGDESYYYIYKTA